MTQGRIPQPKALNDLKGDPHKRRRHQAEPEPPKDRPTRPEHLDEIARSKWDQIVEQLDGMGLLSSADADAIEMYASAYSRYRHAEKMMNANGGEVIMSPVNNFPMYSPWATAMNKNLEVCRRYQIEFGLTPASRSRCAITKKDDSNGWGEFFNVMS